jgi:hypothetical protein
MRQRDRDKTRQERGREEAKKNEVGEEKKVHVENQPKSHATLDKSWWSTSPNSSNSASSLICVLIYSTLFAPSSLILISYGNNYGPIQKVQVSMLQVPL